MTVTMFSFSDVDECASPEYNDCHKLAYCMNTWGGFRLVFYIHDVPEIVGKLETPDRSSDISLQKNIENFVEKVVLVL